MYKTVDLYRRIKPARTLSSYVSRVRFTSSGSATGVTALRLPLSAPVAVLLQAKGSIERG